MVSIDDRLNAIIRELIGNGITLAQAVEAFEGKYIVAAMTASKGNVTQASRKLGVHRNTLHNKLRTQTMLNGFAESVREARVDFREPRFRLRQRRAAGRRQPEPPRASVIRVGAPPDQVCRRHPVNEPADAGWTEIERRARLAHQHAVALAQHEQQAGLRGRDPALLGLRRDPALQPTLRDAEQENQAILATGGHLNAADLFRMRTI